MGKENKKGTRICRVGRGRIEKVGKKGGVEWTARRIEKVDSMVKGEGEQ